jgi:hypothetical protein
MSVTGQGWTGSMWFHNGNERNTWLSVLYSGNDLCGPGDTVTVRFKATTDNSLPTTFLVDDVSLQVCCPDDAYEPNDSFAAARAVSPGTYDVWLCPNGDQDWFQFNAAAGQTIVADLTPAGAAQCDVCLFRPDGSLAACSPNPNPSAPEHINSTANQTGAWRLRVYDPGGGTSTAASQLKIQVYGQAATPTATRKPGAVKYLPIIMKQRVIPAATPTPTRTPTPTAIPAVIFSDNFNSGTLSGWNANGGGWGIENNYLRGVLTTNNAWYIKNASGSNFTYEGDVNILSGNAVGLTFRSSANGASSYDVILDVVDGAFKISKRPGYIVLASYPLAVSNNHWYHVKVVANGNTLEGYLDGVKRLTVTDNNFASGQFGVMLFCATGAYDNLVARTLP